MSSFDFAHAPGHLIRRAHQVSVAMFSEAAQSAGCDITQVQFAILNALIDRPGIDQVCLAQLVALDPATSGSVIGRLEAKGWLRRETDALDRRRRLLWVTEAGRQTVAVLMEPIGASQRKLLEALAPDQASQLLALLTQLVAAGQKS